MRNKTSKAMIVITVFIVLVIIIVSWCSIHNSKKYCKNELHRFEKPVNPYCEYCGERTGISKHICKSNNALSYCRVCGKKIKQ